MIVIDDHVALDPERLIRCGDHRMRIVSTNAGRGNRYRQVQECVRCGWTVKRPDHEPYIDCPAGPVTE